MALTIPPIRMCGWQTGLVVAPILQTGVFIRSADGGSVLLLHRDKDTADPHHGKYLSLGGHVEPGEDVLTCARREVFEESGLVVTDLVLRGTVLWSGFGVPAEDVLCFMFRADAYAGEHHGGNEEGTLEWVPLDELDARPMWESDHLWLPMIFDEEPPFHGVMPYAGYEMVSWTFSR